MCPDNNLLAGDRVVLIDLEFATVRHAAWDLAYLTAPWPSCWCAWTCPQEAVDAALAAWRAAAHPLIEQLHADDLAHDLGLATDAWRWLSGYWQLDSLAGPPRPDRPERPTPPMQDRLVHGLRRTAGSRYLPELAAYAEPLAKAATARWAARPLGPMPAFA